MNMSGAADVLRKAMKGFGTDEDALIKILAPMGPLEVESVKDAFRQNHKRDLMKDVHSETSGYFRDGLEQSSADRLSKTATPCVRDSRESAPRRSSSMKCS